MVSERLGPHQNLKPPGRSEMRSPSVTTVSKGVFRLAVARPGHRVGNLPTEATRLALGSYSTAGCAPVPGP